MESFSTTGYVLFLCLGVLSVKNLWDFTVLICTSFYMFIMLQNKVYLKQLLQDSLGKRSQIFVTLLKR